MKATITLDDVAVEQGGDDPYADLGLADSVAMLIKAQLARQIGQIIRDQSLTQTQAAQLVGMPQPKLSEMLRGHFRGVSQAKMIECLNRLGQDVDIVVKPARQPQGGQTWVVVA